MAAHPLRADFARGNDVPFLTRADRLAIEMQIEKLIALLDTADGDCDFEDDDPAGDPLDAGEGDEGEIMAMRPAYGIDQARGPINEREAYVAHQMVLYAQPVGRSSAREW